MAKRRRRPPTEQRHAKLSLAASSDCQISLQMRSFIKPDYAEAYSNRGLMVQELHQLAAAVASYERVVFYSLQKGQPAESDLAKSKASGWDGPEILDYTSELGDFADTAALVDNLDLVISVDTATAHLVGALGKPIWILNRYDTCWRWLLDRDDSPWYPTASLYRQERPYDGDGVLERVKADLVVSLPSIS